MRAAVDRARGALPSLQSCSWVDLRQKIGYWTRQDGFGSWMRIEQSRHRNTISSHAGLKKDGSKLTYNRAACAQGCTPRAPLICMRPDGRYRGPQYHRALLGFSQDIERPGLGGAVHFRLIQSRRMHRHHPPLTLHSTNLLRELGALE